MLQSLRGSARGSRELRENGLPGDPFDQSWRDYARDHAPPIVRKHRQKDHHNCRLIQRILPYPSPTIPQMSANESEKENGQTYLSSLCETLMKAAREPRTYYLHLPAIVASLPSHVLHPPARTDNEKEKEDGKEAKGKEKETEEGKEREKVKEQGEAEGITSIEFDSPPQQPQQPQHPKAKKKKSRMKGGKALPLVVLLLGTDEAAFDCELIQQMDGSQAW